MPGNILDEGIRHNCRSANAYSIIKRRFEQPNEALFAPPQSGYQRYESLHAMTDEMTRRVWNVMQRPDHSIAFPPSTVRPPVSPNGGRPVY